MVKKPIYEELEQRVKELENEAAELKCAGELIGRRRMHHGGKFQDLCSQKQRKFAPEINRRFRWEFGTRTAQCFEKQLHRHFKSLHTYKLPETHTSFWLGNIPTGSVKTAFRFYQKN